MVRNHGYMEVENGCNARSVLADSTEGVNTAHSRDQAVNDRILDSGEIDVGPRFQGP